MKSKVLRAAAFLSSVSIGLFLVFRASTGCGSSDGPAKVDPDPAAVSAAASQPAATSPLPDTTASAPPPEFFPGSKAPGGTGLRPSEPEPKPSVSVPVEFFGGSKSAPFRPSKGNPTPNAPNQQVQPQGK